MKERMFIQVQDDYSFISFNGIDNFIDEIGTRRTFEVVDNSRDFYCVPGENLLANEDDFDSDHEIPAYDIKGMEDSYILKEKRYIDDYEEWTPEYAYIKIFYK